MGFVLDRFCGFAWSLAWRDTLPEYVDLTRRQAITAISALFTPPCALPFGRSKFHSFSVFSLLRPNNLEIRPVGTARLHCSSSEGFRVIESGQSLRLNSKSVPVTVAGPDGAPVGFVLELPGIIRRAYLGKLQVRTQGNTLRPVVYMDGEVAVGSIVGAELPIGSAAFGALAAQAVLARSFITGTEKPRHKDAEFCDTTHCQFLRAPAAAETEVRQAVLETLGFVCSTFDGPFPPRYSGACGGRTEAFEENGFVYSSVNCETCRWHGIGRRGHGIGLCQEGALALARRGWTWPGILRKYYPGVLLKRLVE